MQKDHHFPFGLDIQSVTNSPTNKYLYNKKELQNGLALYDYGARFYDPVIGRWTSIDPLAEKYRRWSPYNYGDDNPIRFIDPDGMGIIVGADGNVDQGGGATYTKNADGTVTWHNATAATQKIGNAMLKTNIGKQQLDGMIASNTKVALVDNTTDLLQDHGTITQGLMVPTQFTNVNGKAGIGSATVTVYERGIDKVTDIAPHSQFVDHNERKPENMIETVKYSKEEHIGAIATHEGTHVTDPKSNSSTNKAPTSETEKVPYQNQREYYWEIDQQRKKTN